jgi:alpha-ketoglutarate-dependent taurine dioxygenase
MPELMKIYTDKNSPRRQGEGWHSDVSCDPEPPMGTILYIKQSPPHGGDTLFASMYAAYDALSERMKTYLAASPRSMTASMSIAGCSTMRVRERRRPIRAPNTR